MHWLLRRIVIGWAVEVVWESMKASKIVMDELFIDMQLMWGLKGKIYFVIYRYNPKFIQFDD